MTPRQMNIMAALEQLHLVKNECRDMEMARALFKINLAIELIHLALDIAPTEAAIEEVRNAAP